MCPVFPESWCHQCPSQSLKHSTRPFVYISVNTYTSIPPLVCSGPVNAGRGSLPIVCSIRPPFSFFPNNRPIDDLIPFFGFLESVKTQNNAQIYKSITTTSSVKVVFTLHLMLCTSVLSVHVFKCTLPSSVLQASGELGKIGFQA